MKSWIEVLQSAVKRGRFTVREQDAAGSWKTCAVGEASAKAPKLVVSIRGNAGLGPEDERLDDLGLNFCDHVSNDNVGRAVETYHEIRARVRELREEKRRQKVTA